jgi:hypothetical protein
MAVRRGPWKLHLKTIDPAVDQRRPVSYDPPLLFNLAQDPSEHFNVAHRHPGVIEQLRKDIASHREKLQPGKPQL